MALVDILRTMALVLQLPVEGLLPGPTPVVDVTYLCVLATPS